MYCPPHQPELTVFNSSFCLMSWEKKNIALLGFTDGRNRGRDKPTFSLTKIHIRKNTQTMGLLRPLLDIFMHLSPVSLNMNLQLEFLHIFGVVSLLCSPCQGNVLGRRKPRPQMQSLPSPTYNPVVVTATRTRCFVPTQTPLSG